MLELEEQVRQLKDVLHRQREFQEKVMAELSTNDNQRSSDLNRISQVLVGKNTGYIGQIHQPVYNIKIYQGQREVNVQ